jgi:protoporphyrinogen oxidase
MASYDYIIVGAGLAGLHTGLELQRRHKNAKIIILERFKYTGGRVVTYKHEKYQWENGAGRIHKDMHPLVMKYMKRYNLTFSPIGGVSGFIEGGEEKGEPRANIFESTFLPMIQGILHDCDEDILKKHTLSEVLDLVVGRQKRIEFLREFGYNSEVDTLRADIALDVFKEEMGSREGFGVCKEGLSALVDGMVADFKRGSGIIETGTRVVNLAVDENAVILKDSSKIVAKKGIILALHYDALLELPAIRGWELLKRVTMRPLLRVYAVFKGSPFKGVPRFVTDSPIRYFIPMSESVAMISYTDGAYAEKLMEKEEVELRDLIMEELRRLLGKDSLPDPIFFKTHPWKSGCSYWLPGDYDVEEASIAAHTPFPGKNVWICGESFSLRQAWMEGALEHAESLLKRVSI